MGFKAFIKAFLGLFFAIFLGILMVFFAKFLGIKILFLVMNKSRESKISIVTSTPLKLFPISKRLYLGPRMTQRDNFSTGFRRNT